MKISPKISISEANYVWVAKIFIVINGSRFYNRYFPFIYNESGVNDAKAKFGSWFDYSLNPRSQIFRRDHGKVTDIQSLFKLMRYVISVHFSFLLL